MIEKIQLIKTRKVKTPSRGHATDAGIDFYMPEDLTQEDMNQMEQKTGHYLNYIKSPDGFIEAIVVKPGQSACIPSGIKGNIPAGYAMVFFNKSGVACKQHLLAGSCVCDAGYTGIWHIDLHNTSSTNPAVIRAGDKIAQFLMIPVETPAVEMVDSEEELFKDVASDRGEGAFGSTGTK